MNNSFSSSFRVSKTPSQVFEAINNVKAWWTDNLKGRSENLNDEFEVQFGDVHYSAQRLTEVIQDKKVVWLVTASNLTFLNNPAEWVGTRIIFDIKAEGNETMVTFTHEGLVPEAECYDACSPAWSLYLKNSLQTLINSGVGRPGFPPADMD